MNNTQKAILYVTAIILSILIFIIFGKSFRFERGKEKPTTTVDKVLIDELYTYIPDSNDYKMDGIYSKYSSIYNINISVVEQMIINYLNNNSKDKLQSITDTDLFNIGVDVTYIKPLYKISNKDLTYGLERVFGNNTNNINFRDAYIDKNTRTKYFDNNLYVYNYEPELTDDSVVFRKYNKYTISNDKTIKIYDYYLKCDKSTNICYNDDRETIVNNLVTYSDSFNIENYLDKLQQYEHTFKFANDSYYWDSTKMI